MTGLSSRDGVNRLGKRLTSGPAVPDLAWDAGRSSHQGNLLPRPIGREPCAEENSQLRKR